MSKTRKVTQRIWAMLVVFLLTVSTTALPRTEVKAATGTTYYVDALSGDDSQSGTSSGEAWKTLNKVNSVTFQPGDSLLLSRGSFFEGFLWPKGSGTSDQPITLGAYGSGAKPIIYAGSNHAAGVQLFNQEYWIIESIEVVGGYQWGIRVSGDEQNKIFNHFRVRDCVVRGVYTTTGNFIYRDSGGIIFYLFDTQGSQFNDVLIEDCTVYDITQYNGIGVWGRQGELSRSTDITIRNCIAYDIGGTGIHITCAENAIIENNLTYRAAKEAGVGVELWRTTGAVIQENESFDIHPIHSGSTNDNGAFDIDYYNKDVIIQHNYGHDSAGYGIIVLGAGDGSIVNPDEKITDDITIRYNIFSNNCRWSSSGWQGEIILSTFGGGSLDGINIHNNTIYSNPVVNAPAFHVISWASLTRDTGQRNFFNNIIYSQNPQMIEARSFNLDNNIYYHTGGAPRWKYNNVTYYNYSSYVSGTGKDQNSYVEDPAMNEPTYHLEGMPTTAFTLTSSSPGVNTGKSIGDMGDEDFFGNAIPRQGAYDIGAHESNFATPVPKVNLALNKTAYADSQEYNNWIYKGNDGNSGTRWCANDGKKNHWWMVDLGQSYELTGSKIHFEADQVNYQYKIEVSEDQVSWQVAVDATDPTEISQIREDSFQATGRYVRLTYTSMDGWWASHYEFEVYGN